MNEYFPLEQTQIELKALLRGDARTWAEIGYLLASVEFYGIWREEAGSFTEWLKRFAVRLGKKESSIWRYLTASRYYIELRKQMLAKGSQCPLLQNLPDRISPENLELLSKIERVVPPELMQSLSERVIAGVATRAELRDAWETFRPVLAGKTARGQVCPPRFDPSDLSQRRSLMEAVTFRGLSNYKEVLFGTTSYDFNEVFYHVDLKIHNIINSKITLDAVVAIGNKNNGQLILNVIEIVTLINPQVLENISTMMKYCDFIWLATHEAYLDGLVRDIPQNIGIFGINDLGHIHVVRQAIAEVDGGQNSYELIKSLLLKTLTR